MIDKNEFKKIYFLKDLPDAFLTEIASIGEVHNLNKESIIFEQDVSHNSFYALLEGKILLNCKASSEGVHTLDEVYPGRCFGVSSLLGESSSAFTAICVEDSKVIRLSGIEMQKLFEEDSSLGFAIMLRVVQLFKSRMDRHTNQFLKSLATHPSVNSIL